MTTAVIIVSYDDPEGTQRAVASVLAQTSPPGKVIVVDNGPGHPAAALGLDAAVVEPPSNVGFAGGVSFGVAATKADWILVLNPDAVAAPDCVERLLEAAADDTVALVGAQILLPDGTVNAGDNPVHLTGVTWSGGFGERRESGPPRSVASVSGAAMLIRRAALEQIGGLNERFFLYHEDVELCWRLRLAGWDVVFQPAATVEHDYDFDKGTRKWFLLERNRAWTVLTCYSARSLVLLAPILLAAEAAIAVKARREGWWPEKRRAWHAVWTERRALHDRRRVVQATRQVGDATMIRLMAAEITTPLAPDAAPGPAQRVMRLYRAAVLRLV